MFRVDGFKGYQIYKKELVPILLTLDQNLKKK